MSGFFVAVAVGLMLLKVYAWFVVLRPHSSFMLNFLYVVFTVFMFWSYARAMSPRPGNKKPLNNDTNRDSECATRYCERCDADKEDHVHHCSVCNRCVYRMDHHCPWTGNCVGWSNKKFFLLFLMYTSLSCWAFNTMASPLVWDKKFHHYEALLKCGWVLTLGIGLLLAGYFVFHLWLLREGKTTLEYLAGKRGELTDCSFRHNVTVYFGHEVWNWWLPTTLELDAAMGGRERIDTDEMVQLVVE